MHQPGFDLSHYSRWLYTEPLPLTCTSGAFHRQSFGIGSVASNIVDACPITKFNGELLRHEEEEEDDDDEDMPIY